MNKTQDSVLRTTFFKNVDASLDSMLSQEKGNTLTACKHSDCVLPLEVKNLSVRFYL